MTLAESEKPLHQSVKGDISYKDVHFSYPSRKDLPVLKGLSFDVKAGEKIALVGYSGAGKSTIIQLLMRFYDYDKGQISIDGVPITSYGISELRKNIAIVPQEVMFLEGLFMRIFPTEDLRPAERKYMKQPKRPMRRNSLTHFPKSLKRLWEKEELNCREGNVSGLPLRVPCLKILKF